MEGKSSHGRTLGLAWVQAQTTLTLNSNSVSATRALYRAHGILQQFLQQLFYS